MSTLFQTFGGSVGSITSLEIPIPLPTTYKYNYGFGFGWWKMKTPHKLGLREISLRKS
jgi:hypothetical protein